MLPSDKGQLEEHINSVTVVFLNTGEAKSLETKGDSYCHFFEQFEVDGEVIQLRLDWSQPAASGFPTLDTDFLDKKTKRKHKLKSERYKARHTLAINAENRIYEWVYRDAKHPFKIIVSWTASITENASATDIITAQVIRAPVD